MTETEEIINIELAPHLCPWKASKQIVEVGGCNKSYFKWVHPYRAGMVENQRKYVFLEWYHVGNRKSYPAYLLSELLSYLPDGYITGYIPCGWYCKDSMGSWSHVEYYSSAVEACTHVYIDVLKKERRK